MKRIICTLIAILMVLAVIPISSLALYGYTDIRYEEQLHNIDLNGKYRLIKNIELSEKWTPIGTASNPFTGVFDGNGYTITGLYVTGNGDNQGFFGCLAGEVKNLRIEGTVEGKNNVGGIAGSVIGGKIEGSTFTGTVSGSDNVGGIAGYVYASESNVNIRNCRGVATVYGSTCIGGIIGAATVNSGRTLSIYSCASVVDTTAKNGIAGGIVGYADVNGGTLDVSRTYNSSVVSANVSAGGIVGEVRVGKLASTVNVSYCYNSEDVRATGKAGSVIGSIYTASGEVASTTAVTVNQFYNIGKIDGTHDGLAVSSVRELANKTTLTKVYNTDYSNDKRDSYEYEGVITSKESLKPSYSSITSLGFDTYTWTSSGNLSYPYIQLIGNNAVIRITEKPVIEGDLKVGGTLTVKSSYAKNDLDYIWYRNGVVIKNATSSKYELTSADSGAMIAVRIVAGRNGNLVGSALSSSVIIAVAAPRPLPPVASYVGTNSVSLVVREGYEYKMNGGAWQSSGLFEGLEENKTYTFYQRVKANGNVSESIASEPMEIVTGKTNINYASNYSQIVIDDRYYEEYCYCDSKLKLHTSLQLHDYEIVWYADGEMIPNSENSSVLYVRDEFVGKKIVAVIKGVNNYTGIFVTEAVIPEHYSAYVYDKVAPTCTEWGYTINFCRHCSSTFYNNYVKPTGHTFGEWIDVKPATCNTDGLQKRVCKCGESETRTTYAHGHNFVFEMEKANCGEDGYSRQRCVICGYCVHFDRFPASGTHSYVTSQVEPTCTEEGGTLHTCSKCGHSYLTGNVPATGHVWGSWTTVTAPTATQKGSEKRVCTVCGATETREIPAGGTGPVTPDIPDGSDVTIEKVDGKDYIFGLPEKAPINYFGGNDVKVYDKSGKVKTTGYIGTGDRVVILNDDGSAFIDAVVVVKGDVDGDGVVTATDYIKVRLAVLKRVDLGGASLYAAVINGGTSVTVKDYTSIRLHIIGTKPLFAK